MRRAASTAAAAAAAAPFCPDMREPRHHYHNQSHAREFILFYPSSSHRRHHHFPPIPIRAGDHYRPQRTVICQPHILPHDPGTDLASGGVPTGAFPRTKKPLVAEVIYSLPGSKCQTQRPCSKKRAVQPGHPSCLSSCSDVPGFRAMIRESSCIPHEHREGVFF
jgi:hypothetical protein